MNWIGQLAPSIASILCAVLVFCFQRRQNRRDAAMDKRAAARQTESLLGLEMQAATGQLAAATAVAVKRGYANGEMEGAFAAYNAANTKYEKFIREQAVEHIAVREAE